LRFHCRMQTVIDYLRKNQSRFIEELCEYVRFPSVSAQPKHKHDLQACADWVVNHAEQIGLEARLCPTQGHPVVIAKTPRLSNAVSNGSADAAPPKKRRPHFLIYGHYDVQPPEPFELWKS